MHISKLHISLFSMLQDGDALDPLVDDLSEKLNEFDVAVKPCKGTKAKKAK